MLKRTLLVLSALTCLVVLVAGLAFYSTIRQVPRFFRRNAELKAQGYYMGEFEFKMVASQHQLSEGRYLETYRMLRRIGDELQSTQGLARMPGHATPEEQMDFLLARQDSATGAFMDPSYPDFTRFAPTCNVVEALLRLSRETGRPLRLKHPLRFLERFGTPEQLRAYLESLLYQDELSARFPGPGPYGPGVSELADFHVLEEAGVARFSEAWKTELRRWFYETQDPATGFWGARIGSARNWRQKVDVNSTFHILKYVLDERGGNQDDRFPLRHGGLLARGILASMQEPVPEDAAGQHAWGLIQAQGAKLLVQYLWPHLTEAERMDVRRTFRRLALQSCRLHRPAEGGFAYYTSSAHADVDGTGLAMNILKLTGVLPGTWVRERLWGKIPESALTPVRLPLRRWEDAVLPGLAGVQSFRVYGDRLPSAAAWDDACLVQIIYPAGAEGCDVMDLRQGLVRFLGSEAPAFGNWTSKNSLLELPLGLDRSIRSVPIHRGSLDLGAIALAHPASRRFYLVGYDLIQVPVLCLELAKD